MTSDQVRQIKDRLNILDIVGSYVKLEKAGKNFKGKSPFTNERTPSFFVSPDKGFYYCFSSGKGGDIFNFIQEIERVDFKDALKLLAHKAGVSLSTSPEAKRLASEKDRLYLLLDLATKFYEVNLRKDSRVVDHLLERGLTKETIVQFRIGFARDDWQDLYHYLKHKKFTDREIERAGLITSKEGGSYYNRFRGRIMFPIADSRGRIVGFSGRIFEGDEKSAKYVNSPEGVLFDKSKVLYGYHFAKPAIAKEDYCIFVEGQFDVLLAQQSGYVNTVAISGTGLSEDQLAAVGRFSQNFYFALDSDKAGMKATRRSVLLALSQGYRVKVVLLREGEDPADTILRSKESWDVAVLEARDYIDYRITLAEREDLSFAQKQDLIAQDLFEIVAASKNASTKEHLLGKIALFLGVPVDSVRSDFNSFTPSSDFSSPAKHEIHTEKAVSELKPIDKNLRKELAFLCTYAREFFAEDFGPREEVLDEQVRAGLDCSCEELANELSPEEKALSLFVFEEKKDIVDFKTLEQNISELLRSIEREALERESKKLREDIRKMQVLEPEKIPTELMKKSAAIRKKIDALRQD